MGLYKPGEPVSLEEGFRDPPAISRLQGWWQLHGSAVSKKEITRHLEAFADKGLGGVGIKDTYNMPRDEATRHIEDIDFMSGEWLDMYAHIAAECRRLGLICWVWLGSGWAAGGPWITPEMSVQGLTFAA